MDEERRASLESLMRANREFYRAFASGDFVAMDRVWSEHRELMCVHPGWAMLRGRGRVMASWRGILRRPPPVHARGEIAELLGEVGVVACVEVLPGAELAATNLFVLEQGRWRMVHHQAGLVANSLEGADDEDDEDDEGEDQGRLLN